MTAPAPTELLKLAAYIEGAKSLSINPGAGPVPIGADNTAKIVAALRQAASVERAEEKIVEGFVAAQLSDAVERAVITNEELDYLFAPSDKHTAKAFLSRLKRFSWRIVKVDDCIERAQEAGEAVDVCDCQQPEEINGVRLISNSCPIHNENPDPCYRCHGDRFISGDWPNMPDEPCPVCNSNAPSGAERVRAVSASPSRSEGVRGCEVQSAALSLLKEYEQWEADIIMENKCWTGQNIQLTDELHERMIQLQGKRNAVLSGGVAQASEESAIDLLAKRISGAEVNYRNAYELHGAGNMKTGRAWDELRRAGNAIRKHFHDREEGSELPSASRGTEA